ncbi:hypothetical protein DPEC_G00150130 [Dallia pectoralis]|uniref:Uncharacterized protein n=1 Tax=Dallia pectoralis TaxID=75939 RepID=A0ACC2GJI2_DALPE|nr:hypothetical protein DPEC_G00150130 [Dallia pectoralis]
MPKSALVIVRYGPYESCGTVEHRTFRLIGLQAALNACGRQTILEKTCDWNTVELVVNGEWGDGKLDPLCKEAVTAVENAY